MIKLNLQHSLWLFLEQTVLPVLETLLLHIKPISACKVQSWCFCHGVLTHTLMSVKLTFSLIKIQDKVKYFLENLIQKHNTVGYKLLIQPSHV